MQSSTTYITNASMQVSNILLLSSAYFEERSKTIWNSIIISWSWEQSQKKILSLKFQCQSDQVVMNIRSQNRISRWSLYIYDAWNIELPVPLKRRAWHGFGTKMVLYIRKHPLRAHRRSTGRGSPSMYIFIKSWRSQDARYCILRVQVTSQSHFLCPTCFPWT